MRPDQQLKIKTNERTSFARILQEKTNEHNNQLQRVMKKEMGQYPSMPTWVQRPNYTQIQRGMKIPEQYLAQNGSFPTKRPDQIYHQQTFMGQRDGQQGLRNGPKIQISKMSSSALNSHHMASKNVRLNTIQMGLSNQSMGMISKPIQQFKHPQVCYSNNVMLSNSSDMSKIYSDAFTPAFKNSSSQKLYAAKNSLKSNESIPIFHPSYFLLSNFPLLCPKDQIYLPVINRLQNQQSKFHFKELYVNIKFLVVQSDSQFWKYLDFLSNMALHGLSQKDIQKGYCLRVALEACLDNFTVKEFNRCINFEQVKSSAVAVSKRIYDYEAIFESQSFKTYENLVDAVFQLYQRLANAENPNLVNIVVNSWYLDTLKVLQIAMIYGNKQPKKVKQMVEKMFNLNKKTFRRDFINFIKTLHNYAKVSCGLTQSQKSLCLLQNLSKPMTAVPNSSKSKSNYHNPERYFTRQIIALCSECLKLFMFVTNIFKFFPSRIKIIFMDNLEFLTTLVKISIRVIYNLRGEGESKKDRKWRFSEKAKLMLNDLEFMMMQKIGQMYKFIFYNAKSAAQQQINKEGTQKNLQDEKQGKIVVKFYKRLIQNLVNRKKDMQKDQNLTFNKTKGQEQTATQNTVEKQNQSTLKGSANLNIQSKKQICKQNPSQNFKRNSQQKKGDQVNDCLKYYTKTSKKKGEQTGPNRVLQKQYGRVILKFLLRKQLKKDQKKYIQVPYFYTQKLLDFYQSLNQSHLMTDSTLMSSSQNFYIHLAVLKQFETEIKSQFLVHKQLDRKFFKVDLMLRQLPSLEEFLKREEIRERDELNKRLSKPNKEYEDQPTQEQQVQFEFEEKFMDQEDYTHIDMSMFNQNNQSQISFRKPGTKSHPNEPLIVAEQDLQNSSSEIWTVPQKNTLKNNNSQRSNRFMQDDQTEQQLSPQEISDLELSQFIDIGCHKSINGSRNSSNQTSIHMSIFKPHQTMKKVSESMLKEQLEYFNRIKDISWHQISRISVKADRNSKNPQAQSGYSSLMAQNSILKVSDIGYSFDMILNQDDQSQFEQGMNTSRSRFTHFYYDQYRDTHQGHKKKSFMENYDWSNVVQDYEPQPQKGQNNDQVEDQQQISDKMEAIQRKNYIKYNGNHKNSMLNEFYNGKGNDKLENVGSANKMNISYKARR